MVVSDWIEHDGKGMPVDGDTLVFVRWSDGDEGEGENPFPAIFWTDGYYDWDWSAQVEDDPRIIAYCIVTTG